MEKRPKYLGATAFAIALVSLLFASPAVAESGEFDTEFRRWVVGEVNWQPGEGVGLTTTVFARRHARAYPEAPAFSDDCDTVSVRDLATGRYLVLFQTEHLDLWVHRRAPEAPSGDTWADFKASMHMDGAALTVTPRGRPCRAISKHFRVGADESRAFDAEFANAIPGEPLELYFQAGGGCGSDCIFSRLEMFRLDKEEPERIYEAAFELATTPGAPPALEPLAIRLTRPGEWPPDGFAYQFRSAVFTGTMTKFGPTVLRTCRWSAASEAFGCNDTPAKTFRWSRSNQSELPVKKAEARFLFEQLDQMRALGWRFDPSYLAEIERLVGAGDGR